MKQRRKERQQKNNVYKLTSSVTKAPLFSVIVAGVAMSSVKQIYAIQIEENLSGACLP